MPKRLAPFPLLRPHRGAATHAVCRFDQRGKVAVHELTSVVPPEPPLLLWPLLLVARMLGRVVGPAEGGAEPQGAPPGRQPIPGAGMVRQVDGATTG